jgi:hypothetical protein
MDTQKQKQTDKQAGNPTVVADTPAPEAPEEQALTLEQAAAQTAVLAQSYTVEDCQAAAKSHRRSLLRSILKG